MTALWTLSEMVAATGGKVRGSAPDEVTGISIDSRTINAGEAFVAIRGDRFDGHDYAPSAIAAGGALALIDSNVSERPDFRELPLLMTDADPLFALEDLGRAARARTEAQIVAVTGSVGKTGTKEMLRTALSTIGPTHAPVGSFNNHWGVPLTLARMPRNCSFAVFEIGMNHAEEIRPLTGQVRPKVAIVTTVGRVHMENFPSEAAIAEAKAEIFDGLVDDGSAVLNRDNQWFDLLRQRAEAQGARVLSFGEDSESDIRLERVNLSAEGSVVQASVCGQAVTYRLGAPGRHLVQNSLSVLGAAHALGLDLAKILLAFAEFKAPSGRGEQFSLSHPSGPFILIDESYNANPVSMRAALELLAAAPLGQRGRRIAVLGDMLELGVDEEEEHAGLIAPLETAEADLVFLCGPIMKSLWQDLPDSRRGAYAESVEDLIPILLRTIGPGDAVMVKASFGTGLGSLVSAIRQRFEPEEM